LLRQNGLAAAGEFQKIINHSGIVLNYPTGALAFVELGRAEAMSGDMERHERLTNNSLRYGNARRREHSILKDAKAEFAKLQ
jgi:eukaryotic-like serine/threonine-protein kinase